MASPEGVEVSEEGLERFFSVMSPLLNERQRRLLAGATARMLGRGGTTLVAKVSGAVARSPTAPRRSMPGRHHRTECAGKAAVHRG